MNLFLMNNVELPLIPVVAAIEENGYPIDIEHFKNISTSVQPQIGELECIGSA
jgi:DNA polymerase I-like protein with 3'-5' exonuclease and polymerase domains